MPDSVSRQKVWDLLSANSTSMGVLNPELWRSIVQKLPNSALCNLAASNKACWRLSCVKRTLKLELTANEQLHGRLVSLLYFLTSRRKHLQVCCVHQEWFLGVTRWCVASFAESSL